MVHHNTTIAAIATPPGRGGIGIVRVSGSGCVDIAKRVLDTALKPRHAVLAKFKSDSGEIIDTGIALFFPGPHSYTGEDVLELQAHGGPVLLDLLLGSTLDAGAQRARAGEFTERAFLNGQLDLSQAEAVADLIDAASERSVRAAQRSLAGEFSKRVNVMTNSLITLRVQLEAGLDFAEDAPGVLNLETIHSLLNTLIAELQKTRRAAQTGKRLRDGFKVVIAGAVNVGKSSLLNQLSGTDSAIVTNIPGTTRDPVRESIIIDGVVLDLTDTAGLRSSQDAVEKIGIERAFKHVRQADLVLLVFADSNGPKQQSELLDKIMPPGCTCLPVQNKIDRDQGQNKVWPTAIAVSAKTGAGIDTLLSAIKTHAAQVVAEGEFSARQRHITALDLAWENLKHARETCLLGLGQELIAEDLKIAQCALDEISGKVSSDDLLGQIFSSFCIGK